MWPTLSVGDRVRVYAFGKRADVDGLLLAVRSDGALLMAEAPRGPRGYWRPRVFSRQEVRACFR